MENQLRRLLELQTAQMAELTSLTIRMIMSLWEPFLRGQRNNRKWYDEDLIIAYSARSSSIIETAQRQARSRILAYIKFVFREMGIPLPTEAELLQEIKEAEYPRQNVSALDVYRRPAEQFRYAESIGKDETEAIEAALTRFEDLIDTDIQLAKREMFNRVMKKAPTVTGYRRVIHPELSESGMSCGLCIAASTRIYSTDELLPIHDHCNCTVMPIIDGRDPGAVFNEEDLQNLYEAAGGNTAQLLSRVRYKLFEHGELGPVIMARGSSSRKVTPPPEVSFVESVNNEIRVLESALRNLQARSARGEDLKQAIDWQRDRIEILKSRLGG